MIGKIRNFRDLDVWKKGMEIAKDIYEIRTTRYEQGVI